MSSMNFNTVNQTFRQLLGNGLTYRVPPFQRDYSWTEDEWDDLWQDILGLYEADGETAHYMGYLVLQSSDHKRFDIIDGQQRITTISIMILSCLGYLDDLVAAHLDADDNVQRKKQLLSSYIGFVDPVTLVSRSKLELNRHNNKYYQNYLVTLDKLPQRNLNLSEHQLRKAFFWFKDKIKQYAGHKQDSGKSLAAFIDSLVDKLFFTVITVNDELNAFKVFETLNARGVRLSSTDLLKNYLFSIVSSADTHETELKSLEDRWETIVGLLGSESFPEYLRVFWNSRNKLVRKADLFKTIRKRILTRENAFSLIRDLDASAAIYAAMRDPQDKLWNHEEKAALKQLAMFNVKQPLAMLLAWHKNVFETDRKSFTKIIQAVAIISLRYNVICSLPTHDQEGVYNDIAWKISERKYINKNDVLNALNNIYPSDKQFVAAFAEKEFKTTNSRNKKVVRYILFSLEKAISGHDFDFESATYNLEHILPEHPSEDWNAIPEEKQDRLIYRLGNMTILDSSSNRDLGNAGYFVKRAVYSQSEFAITSSIAKHYEVWDENKIDSRQNHIAEKAASIWRID
ncbi:MAG: DUF262 domain-containing HNH endonuclease family protein [Bacillota bacterium]